MLPELKPIEDEVYRCIRCGQCRSVCPVFGETMDESFVARARVALARAIIEGQLPSSEELSSIIDHCLLCMKCVKICPGSVKVPDIVMAARNYLFKQGHIYPAFCEGLKTVSKQGRLFEVDEFHNDYRIDLGLPALEENIGEIEKLFEAGGLAKMLETEGGAK